MENLQNENEILSASLEQSRLKIIEVASNNSTSQIGLHNYELIMEQQKGQWEQDRKKLEAHLQAIQVKNEEIEKDKLNLLKSLEAMRDYNAIKAELGLLKVVTIF